MKDAEQILSLELPCDPAAPAAVRGALAEVAWLGWVLGDVMLVASELVANAVSHSGGLRRHALNVDVTRTAGTLRISVRDPGLSGQRARPRHSEELTAGGWGLLIVEQLAARWGEERGDGYLVWAEVELPPGTGPGSGAGAAQAGRARTAARSA